MFWSFLASAGRLFLSPHLLPSWVLKNCSTSWKVRDAVWVPTFALHWQCFWYLKLVKDLQVQGEVSGFHSKGSKNLHDESSHLKKSQVGQPDINRGTGSILCWPTKVLFWSWCLGLSSVFLKVKAYHVRRLKKWKWKWSCSVVSESLQPHGLYSLPGSSLHGILQARVLEWVAISFSRRLTQHLRTITYGKIIYSKVGH